MKCSEPCTIQMEDPVAMQGGSLCQRLGFVSFTDKAASAEGARNERFSASKVCRRQTHVFTLVPSGEVAPKRVIHHYHDYEECAMTGLNLA